MADEQTIYLSPEEELTSVRERLERTQARRIILVIPQQTSLRSHVGWRLIHARMRELGKELLVISPDRQVRAVARAAGFKVAETQEPSSNRPRLGGGTRPGALNTRGGARSRAGSSRGGPQSQAPTGRRRLTPSASNRPMIPPPTPIQPDYEEEATLERPRKSEPPASGGQPIAPAAFFGQPQDQFGPSYDFRINTTPSVRPSVPHIEENEDEDNKYYEDYRTARNIRESASGGAGEKDSSLKRGADESRASAASRWGVDPYAYLEEEQQQQTRLPEQRGSVRGPLDELDAGVPDISDRSTEIMANEIEDLGDMGALDLPQVPSAQEEPPVLPPRQRPRTGQMQSPARRSPRAPRPGLQDFNEDEDLLASPERPAQKPSSRSSRDLAGARPRQSQTLSPGAAPQTGAKARQSQGLAPGGPPQAGARMRVAPSPAPVAQRPPNRQLIATPSAPSRQPVRRRARRSNRGLVILFSIVVVLLAAALLLLYLLPTATVTISLQAQAFSQNVQLNATADPNSTLPNKVAAQMLQHDFSASGQGTASGTTKVGNAKASGLVTFTNNGSAPVVIPTGTIVATPSGVQFATGAEVAVGPPPNNTFPAVPVSAQQAGEIGNVPANSITVIPSASLNSIAQYNHTSVSSLNLAVTNAKATSGGGAANVPAVTTRDLQALVRTLHEKLKQQVNAWLTQQIHSGDMHGALRPDVLNSTGPLPQEQLSGAPGAGQPASSGTFSGTLSLHISMLVARAAALQAAAGAQLNAAAARLRPPSMLATHLPVTLSNSKGTPSPDGTSLAISAKATGEIIRQVSVQDISNALTGKGVGQVASDLKASMAQAGVQNVQVSIFPPFLNIMPLQAGRIQVILKPVMQTPPGNVPNG
jgi:hypothetical protein